MNPFEKGELTAFQLNELENLMKYIAIPRYQMVAMLTSLFKDKRDVRAFAWILKHLTAEERGRLKPIVFYG